MLMTVRNLRLPADLARQYPPEMAVRVEEHAIVAYQHPDATGGRWMLGFFGGDPSADGLRRDVVDYHAADATARY